jgi:hypothetical protein
MSNGLESLPGMTRCAPLPSSSLIPTVKLDSLVPMLGRRLAILSTTNIHNDNIFNNGLYQNVYFIYKLLESMGWMTILMVNEKPKTLDQVPAILQSCRYITIDELLKKPVKIGVFIEIGMSVEPKIRQILKLLGAKVTKLYLGNILNIDIETPVFTPSIDFSHHVAGNIDEIWTSPHYAQHDQYCAAINGLPPSSCKIAPYVWDATVITRNYTKFLQWRPRRSGEKPTFLIMEPNISFQKNSLIPLLIAEKYHNTFPEDDIRVVIYNGKKLHLSPHFERNILPYLNLHKEGRIQYEARATMLEVQEAHPHAIPIVHHINNEFNYMTLEFMYAGFPVLHNCGSWRDFGYFYPENDIVKGVIAGLYANRQHADSLQTYMSHAKTLFWRHSPYNPDVQNGWKELLP